jgi:double-stranded uracil-DNA glycosylase
MSEQMKHKPVRTAAVHHPLEPEHLPDLLAADLDVLFCGINPAMSAARSGHHFSSKSNRFWRVLHLAGFTPHQLHPEHDRTILHYGYGLTAAVARPTIRASELSKAEFHASAEILEQRVRKYRPRFLAFLGKPAFAALFQRRNVEWGLQDVTFGGAHVWVLPNPSGLNRAFNLDALVSAYRELRVALENQNH